MIDVSPELRQFLATARSFVMADLYTITLASGQVLRYTDTGVQLFADGANYSASGPLLKRTGIRTVRGVEVDTLSVTLYAGVEDTLLGEPILAFIAGGGFDGASLSLAGRLCPTGQRQWLVRCCASLAGLPRLILLIASRQRSRSSPRWSCWTPRYRRGSINRGVYELFTALIVA